MTATHDPRSGAPAPGRAPPAAPPASRPRCELRLEKVSRWYGDVLALDAVDLVIGPGVTGLLGPNGAGKSTLFNILSGIERPDEGSIFLEGKPVTDLGIHQRAIRIGRALHDQYRHRQTAKLLSGIDRQPRHHVWLNARSEHREQRWRHRIHGSSGFELRHDAACVGQERRWQVASELLVEHVSDGSPGSCHRHDVGNR